MSNGWQSCKGCSHQLSVMAGTVFQDSKLPLTTWFRAMWHVASQKNGISALGVQRDLGLGSYKTAWSLCISCAVRWLALDETVSPGLSKSMKLIGVQKNPVEQPGGLHTAKA